MKYIIIVVVASFAFSIVGSIISVYFEHKCPKCKKSWALVFTKKTDEWSEPCSKMEKHDIKDKSGKVIGEFEQRVSGTRVHWIDVYTCKFCGETVKKKASEDKY